MRRKAPGRRHGRAIMITKIASGEIEDEREAVKSAAVTLGRKDGKKRDENMKPERRSEIARKWPPKLDG